MTINEVPAYVGINVTRKEVSREYCRSRLYAMKQRVNSKEWQEKNGCTKYNGCRISKILFRHTRTKDDYVSWFINSYYVVYKPDGTEYDMQLDHDIKVFGNKLYSLKTMLLIPQHINLFFEHLAITQSNLRYLVDKNQWEIVSKHGSSKLYKLCDTEDEAIELYCKHKNEVFNKMVDEIADQLPVDVYLVLMNADLDYRIKTMYNRDKKKIIEG